MEPEVDKDSDESFAEQQLAPMDMAGRLIDEPRDEMDRYHLQKPKMNSQCNQRAQSSVRTPYELMFQL